MTTWIKVFNSMPSHPKFVKAGERAAWLFVCGCCFANEHLTDGFVPAEVLPVVAPGVRGCASLAAALVRVGLWEKVEGGWRIHDYDEHQRSSAEIRERRAKDRVRQAERRASHGSPRGHVTDTAPTPQGVPSVSEVLDVEGREQRAETEGKATRKRATRRVDQSQLPEDFPDELESRVDAVLPILHRCWDVRGGIEPGRRGVGLAVMRCQRADHEQVARKLEHWLLAGKGQRARCADVASRFGDWVEGDGAAQSGQVVPLRKENASDWLREDFIDGEPVSDAEVVGGGAS